MQSQKPRGSSHAIAPGSVLQPAQWELAAARHNNAWAAAAVPSARMRAGTGERGSTGEMAGGGVVVVEDIVAGAPWFLVLLGLGRA